MTLKMSDYGIAGILQTWIGALNGNTWKLRLFVNNYTPTTADTPANYVEATFPGYAPINTNTWANAVTAAHIASSTDAARTFTRNAAGAAQSVYGYYVTDPTGANLGWAERDPLAPVTMNNAGDTYTVTPKLTCQDLST